MTWERPDEASPARCARLRSARGRCSSTRALDPPPRLRTPSRSKTRAHRPGYSPPEIHRAFTQGATTGSLDDSLIEWFSQRSTTRRSHKVDAPTLIIQGTVDTLFPLNDGFENYRNLVRAGTPAKLITYCAGHTLGCPYAGGASGDPMKSFTRGRCPTGAFLHGSIATCAGGA